MHGDEISGTMEQQMLSSFKCFVYVYCFTYVVHHDHGVTFLDVLYKFQKCVFS